MHGIDPRTFVGVIYSTAERESFSRARESCVFHPLIIWTLILICSGCATANVSERLASHPIAYRRIAILPVCFSDPAGASYDSSVAERYQAGAQLASALTNRLARKGYTPVGPVCVLGSAADWCQLDWTANQILRRQFDLEKICAGSAATNASYAREFASSLPLLEEKLGYPQSDAMLLLDHWVEYGPPARPMPPVAETGALSMLGLLATAGGDVEMLGKVADDSQHQELLYGSRRQPGPADFYSLYLFDSHTHEILYYTYQPHGWKSPNRATRDLLRSLPDISQ